MKCIHNARFAHVDFTSFYPGTGNKLIAMLNSLPDDTIFVVADDERMQLNDNLEEEEDEFINLANILPVDIDASALFPHTFHELTAGEIYDLFVKDKANKMGVCGRTVLTAMKRDKALFSSILAEDDWVQTLGTSMARLKEGRTQQRSKTFLKVAYTEERPTS